jgi:hypothetical protein
VDYVQFVAINNYEPSVHIANNAYLQWMRAKQSSEAQLPHHRNVETEDI